VDFVRYKGIDGKETLSPMEDAIRRVLEAHGKLEEFQKSEFFYMKIQREPWMDLIIEKHGDEVVVAHYGEQNGDLMADPDMTFSIKAGWRPMTFTNHYVGVFTRASWYEDGILLTDTRAHKDLVSFVRVWAKNIREQGFADSEGSKVLKVEGN
jgi:hypothetical protein